MEAKKALYIEAFMYEDSILTIISDNSIYETAKSYQFKYDYDIIHGSEDVFTNATLDTYELLAGNIVKEIAQKLDYIGLCNIIILDEINNRMVPVFIWVYRDLGIAVYTLDQFNLYCDQFQKIYHSQPCETVDLIKKKYNLKEDTNK